ncbi:MAG: alpha/beta hydrolase domain-containing protein [Pyrinomonadaceae bacterium]
MSNIESPLSKETAGKFNRISYVRYRGRFTGETSQGTFSVPYEVTAPSTPDEGNLRLLVEVPHFTTRVPARVNILGSEFLFGRGFSHAAVGYSTIGNRILDPDPGFEIVIAGVGFNPSQPQTDREIITQFAGALRGNPFNLVGNIKKVYSIGFSDSGDALHSVLNEAHGRDAFDLSFPCIASFGPVHKPAPVSGKVIVYNTENDFIPVEGEAPNQRWYVGAGCPHISDSEHSRTVFTGPPQSPLPPIKGTTPLNWSPFMKALFIAGDRWVTEGEQPPPTTLLNLTSAGQIQRDAKGNSLGGIRHPALEVGEAKFMASVNIPVPQPPPPVWLLFGGYDHVRSIGDADFFKNVGQYVKAFDAAAKALGRAGFLLDEDEKDLTRKAKLNPSSTFTQNYKAGLF